jgi:hypothetical protein
MSSYDEGFPGTPATTGSHAWQTGRRWAQVAFVVIVFVMVAAIVLTLTDDTVDVRPASIALGLFVLLLAAHGALTEFRGRVEVDETGVHQVTAFRRRTYPWNDIVRIRQGRRVRGTIEAELVRNAGVVRLPNSGEHVDALRRWHAASTR